MRLNYFIDKGNLPDPPPAGSNKPRIWHDKNYLEEFKHKHKQLNVKVRSVKGDLFNQTMSDWVRF